MQVFLISISLSLSLSRGVDFTGVCTQASSKAALEGNLGISMYYLKVNLPSVEGARESLRVYPRSFPLGQPTAVSQILQPLERYKYLPPPHFSLFFFLPPSHLFFSLGLHLPPF